MKIRLCDKRYKEPLKLAAASQMILLFCASLVLDCGVLASIVSIAMAACWGSAITLVIHRRWNPSKVDIQYIQAGIIIILPLVPLINYLWLLGPNPYWLHDLIFSYYT